MHTRAVVAACLLCGLTGCASLRSDEWRIVAVSAVCADVALTTHAINRGAVERNPILGVRPTPAKLVAINAVVIAAIWVASRHMAETDKASLWKWTAILHAGFAAWNAQQVASSGAPQRP